MADALAGWRWELPAALGPVDQDPDAVREDACLLLSPEIECDPPSPDLDGNVSPDGGSGGGGGGALVWLLLGAAVVVLVALIVRSIATRVRDRDAADDTAARDGEEIVPLEDALIDPDNSPADWRSRSQQHRAAAEYRDALRCEYRALVGDLARRNLLDEIPGRTTGEERAQLRRTTPVVTQPFGTAADMFDGVWYGASDATAAMVERFDELEREILAATGRTRRPVEAT